MQDRREFLKIAATATVLTCIGTPRAFSAGSSDYANIVYTTASPGHWAGKEGIHAPQVTIQGSKVAVVTKHPMSDDHFIVRHTVVLGDGTFVGGTTFKPVDKPESSYDLPAGYKGKIMVTSFCNLHDFWLTETTV